MLRTCSQRLVNAIQRGWNQGDESHPPPKGNDLVSAVVTVASTDLPVTILPRTEIQNHPDATAMRFEDASKLIQAGGKFGIRFSSDWVRLGLS
jgi:hypothetical protein